MFYKFVRALVYLVFRIIFRMRFEGLENIPKEGPVVLTANHIHICDAFLMAFCTKRQVHLIGKKELFDNKITGPLCRGLGAFPADRNNPKDISVFREALKILKADKVLGIFFQGTRQENDDVENAKSGVALFAVKGRAPIVPISITGHYHPFKKVYIKVGAPMDFSEYHGKKLGKEDLNVIVEEITRKVLELR